MSFFSTVVTDVEGWLKTVGDDIVAVIKAIIVAEQQTFVTEIVPLIKQAAVTIQNEMPGLSAKDFIPAVIAAVVPLLPIALADIEYTALSTLVSVVAGQLGVPNTPGNQGNVNA